VLLGVSLALVSLTACGDGSGQRDETISTSSTGPTTLTAVPVDTVDADHADDSSRPPGTVPVDEVRWEPCDRLECATVSVPLRYGPDGTAVTGERLELALVRKPASGTAVGTIFVNPGGPGASGVDFIRAGFDLGPEIGSRFHLVGFDPRGVGDSAGLRCGRSMRPGPRADSSPDNETERRLLEAEARSMADQCARLDGQLVANISTSIAARDLDRLRRAVGDETLTYYGLSYGTVLGLRYAELHPENVGHIVLDGVIDPGLDLQALLRLQAEAFEEAFIELDGRCGTPLLARCPEGGLVTAFDGLMDRLEAEGPIDGFGPTELSYAALIALYSPDLWPVLAQGLDDAADSDVATLRALHDRLTGAVQFTSYAAYLCQDSPVPGGPEQWRSFADDLATLAPRFGATVANELLACVYWPSTGLDRPAPIEAAGARPILVIGTTGDPATPLIGAQRVAETLDSARLVVVEGFHHTAIGYNACAGEIVRRYLVDSTLPPANTRCSQDGKELLDDSTG
jgi:pimeloyl-ACP methyl ester carboxylesterase